MSFRKRFQENVKKGKRTVAKIQNQKLIYGLAIAALSIVICVQLSAIGLRAGDRAAVSTINVDAWGLGFGKEGQRPTGNVSSDVLRQYNAYYVDDTDTKNIYLTFDAGYENGYTETILDVLKEKNVKAAFFVVGSYIRQNPELVRRMVEEGHIVGNHTDKHPDMSKIQELSAFQTELDSVRSAYKDVTGEEMPYYYRPPQGKFSEANLAMAKQLGYKTVFWSLAYVDWYDDRQPTQEEAFNKLIPRVHDGCILLLHSTSRTNAAMLGTLIDRYEALGYSFATLDQLP